MLITITRCCDLDAEKLMGVYAESNRENTEFFYPDLADKAEAVRRVEAGFLAFLNDEFFTQPGSVYWVLEENGVWVSALRTSRIRPGLYYMEALETRPDSRNRGCAARLLSAVIEALKQGGAFRLCDCVGKTNTASLRTHAACGFRIVSEDGFDYLQEESDPRAYGLEHSYPRE